MKRLLTLVLMGLLLAGGVTVTGCGPKKEKVTEADLKNNEFQMPEEARQKMQEDMRKAQQGAPASAPRGR